MNQTITVTNQKGGAGKTTTAAALAAGLLLRGYKTLAIDLDPQGNLSYSAQANKGNITALELLTGNATATDAIQHLPSGDIIPSTPALAGADALITATGKEYRLKEALAAVADSYDYIIIDTPPALGILTINALTASTSVIIPAQADIYSLQGIEQLAATIKPIKKYCNPDLFIEGILLTRYNGRSILSRDVAEIAKRIADTLGTKLFTTTIREAIAVKEAQISRQTLYSYAPKAKVTADYNAFIDELLKERI